MRFFVIALLLSSCSFKQFYPTTGAIVGGAAGGALGGPLGGGLGAGGGALLGEVARGNAEIEEARDTINALSRGDVEALVSKGMEKHASGFESFTNYVKRVLMIAGVLLCLYLVVPVFVAKKCSKSEVTRSLTRPPMYTGGSQAYARPGGKGKSE